MGILDYLFTNYIKVENIMTTRGLELTSFKVYINALDHRANITTVFSKGFEIL